MLENPCSDSPAPAAIKRYAPPNQRNRSLGRRKSGGDRLERGNIYTNDVERNPLGPTKIGLADYGDSGYNNRTSETNHMRLIPLKGCCNSEASQLLNNRWAATMNSLNTLPEDSTEKPVLYTRKGVSPWGQAILPHLMIQPTGGMSTGSQKDFLSELRLAMDTTNSGLNA